MEKWKDCFGYEGYYQVSDLGRVRSVQRWTPTKRGYDFLVKSKVLKPLEDRYGYLTVGLWRNRQLKFHKIHRLVALAFYGFSELTVNHKDCNKKNNFVENLEFMESEDNCALGHKNGCYSYSYRGAKHHNIKLSLRDKVEIELMRSEVDAKTLGEYYGVHRLTINKIWRSNPGHFLRRSCR